MTMITASKSVRAHPKWWPMVACAAVLGLPLIPSNPANAAFPGVNGKIVFQSDEDPDNSQIWSMNADGTEQTRLTNNTDDFEPAWSPDGRMIVFHSWRDDNAEIYVMKADGSAQTRLTNNTANDFDPAWSPDGTKIAFESQRDGNFEIYVMNPDGSALTRLTNNSANDYEPAWSPDGTRIAFETDRDRAGGADDIYLMNIDGTAQTRLTDRTWDYDPNWSPDGTTIVFGSDRDPGEISQIFVINVDGSGEKRLTYPGDDYTPAWSPDGAKIAFGSGRDGDSGEIYVMNPDGSGQTRLTNNPRDDSDPDWQRLQSAPTRPDTTILSGPKAKTTDRTPKFKFTSSEDESTFQCKLDSRPFVPCASPTKYGSQKPGKHTFSVMAINPFGYFDPTPATRAWKVTK